MCDPDVAFLSEQPEEHLPLPSEASFRKALYRAGKDLEAARAHTIWEDHAATIHVAHFRKVCRDGPATTLQDFAKIIALIQSARGEQDSLLSDQIDHFLENLTLPPDASSFLKDLTRNSKFDINQFWMEYEEVLHQCAALKKEQLKFLPAITPSTNPILKDPFHGAIRNFEKLLPNEWSSDSVRGCVILESPDQLFANEFELELEADTELLVSVQAIPMATSSDRANPSLHDIDLDLFLLRHVDGKRHKRLTAFTHMVTPKKQSYFRQRVPAGIYSLITYTSSAWFDSKAPQNGYDKKAFSREKLAKNSSAFKDPNLVELSDQYEYGMDAACRTREALSDIFEMIDLNGDGVVDREEFGIFALRTTGEELKDADWHVVTTTFCWGKDYLDKEAFLQLHRMEVRDSNEEELKDVWLTLASMGYNFDLSLDKAIVFSLNVGCSDGEPIIAATHIKPTSRLIEKCISRAAVEGDDYEQLEDGILLHKFTTPNRRCLVLQNTSTQERTVESALLESFNCMSSKEFPMRVNLPPNSCEMIAQFVPFDNTLPWRFCTREITE